MNGLTYLNNIIDKRYENYDTLHRKYGIVKQVLSFARAIVTIEDENMLSLQENYKEQGKLPPEEREYDTKTRDLNLLNKTGEQLAEGDSVWVYYWHDIASGYIALRIGGKKIENAKAFFERVAVMPSPIPNNIYSNAKIYSQDVWEQAIQSRTYIIDNNNNLTFQNGFGRLDTNQPRFNLFLINGFPAITVPYLGDWYYGGGGYNRQNRRYIVDNLNLINPQLFSSKITVKGSIGFIEYPNMYISDYYRSVFGDLTFEVAAYKDYRLDYYDTVIKLTCNGEEHLIRIGNVYADGEYEQYRIPQYYSEEEVYSNVSLIMVASSGRIVYEDRLTQTVDIGIAIRCKKTDGGYGWGLIDSVTARSAWDFPAQFIHSYFNNINEYYYCICAI